MKKSLPFFLLLFSCLSLLGQQVESDSTLLGTNINPKYAEQKQKDNREWGIDFHLLGTSIHWAKPIKKEGLLIGGELGAFPDALKWIIVAGNHYIQKNSIWNHSGLSPVFSDYNDVHQLYFVHGFLRMKNETNYGWFDVDVGFRYARFLTDIPFDNDWNQANFYSAYFKPMLGRPKFKGGVRISYGLMKEKEVQEFLIMLSPFMRFIF